VKLRRSVSRNGKTPDKGLSLGELQLLGHIEPHQVQGHTNNRLKPRK